MKTLITARFDKNYISDLETITKDYKFAGYGVTAEKMPKDELIKALEGVELLITEFEDINSDVLAAASTLKFIACCRNEAFASVDIEAATANNIPVVRAGGRNAIAVAEHTIALLMDISKNISLTDHLLKHTDQLTKVAYQDADGKRAETMSEWSMDADAPFALYGGGPEMYGKIFGQIGYGAIGREVAKRAHALGMRIYVYDPYIDENDVADIEGELKDLDTLMSQSDFISINCNVVPETIGLMSREKIALMKPTAYLVNTARAKVMDYDALYDALAQKKIAGAGLDVYPVEPIPHGDKFLSLTNVVMTPHLAGSSRDIVSHQSRIVLNDIKRWIAGDDPKFICNPQALSKEKNTM